MSQQSIIDRHKAVRVLRSIMRRHGWLTLKAITDLLYISGIDMAEQSASARVRDLRKDEYGGHDVRRRYAGNGVWEYRIFPRRKGAK